MNTKQFFEGLDKQGKSLGVRFNNQPLMSNSNLAMQAGEFARDSGVYKAYHQAVFKAFFTDCLDIGKMTTISDIIGSLGLETDDLEKALIDKRYVPVLTETKKQAAVKMITAAPTFFIEGGTQITGAQPLETFRIALEKIGDKQIG